MKMTRKQQLTDTALATILLMLVAVTAIALASAGFLIVKAWAGENVSNVALTLNVLAIFMLIYFVKIIYRKLVSTADEPTLVKLAPKPVKTVKRVTDKELKHMMVKQHTFLTHPTFLKGTRVGFYQKRFHIWIDGRLVSSTKSFSPVCRHRRLVEA